MGIDHRHAHCHDRHCIVAPDPSFIFVSCHIVNFHFIRFVLYSFRYVRLISYSCRSYLVPIFSYLFRMQNVLICFTANISESNPLIRDKFVASRFAIFASKRI
jgi:hypothetical protein